MAKHNRILLTLIISLAALCCRAQDSTTIYLGDSAVQLVHTANERCPCNILLINVHENEQTSVAVATAFIQEFPADFVRLKQHQQRNLEYGMLNTPYIIDPNRMFSMQGRIASLQTLGNYDPVAERSAGNLADSLLERYVDKHKVVVAMHNNTPDTFTVRTYLKGRSKVYINPKADHDDFVVTTSLSVFNYLKKNKINAVWETHNLATDDGSLLIYCSRKKIPYINIEAEHGHEAEQARMLQLIGQWLRINYRF
jgi:hypothetical protein